MCAKFDALMKNRIWDLVPQKNQSLIGFKWIFHVKRKPDGSIAKYKARLVAKVFHQRSGIYYTNTFSPIYWASWFK